MKARILNELCGLEENQAPLELTELPDPIPSANEILIRVSACGVCHTELDEIEGRTHPPRLLIVLEHASSVWQAMKIYVRISKMPVEMQMEDMPSI